VLYAVKRVLWVMLFWLSAAPILSITGGAEVYAQVDTAWVRRYNGLGNSDDRAVAVTVDKSGNVFVTGQSYGAGANVDYATIKYYSSGDTAWVRRYNGSGNGNDYVYAMTADTSGNVYITGGIDGGLPASFDYATIKYKPNGDTVWVRRYNGGGNSVDVAVALAVDRLGFVYVTGQSSGPGINFDYATVVYYPDGNLRWIGRYNGPADSTDGGSAIAVDDSGDVIVSGWSYGSGTEMDYATVKYKSSGDTAWVRRYNGTGDSIDYPVAIAVDASENIYVTGSSWGGGTDYDYATIKYYPNGDTAWVRRYNGTGDSTDLVAALAVDSSGNVYVTGRSYGSGTNSDYATIKYKANGDTAWVRRYNGSGNWFDVASSMAVDGSGNVYVTGTSRTTTGDDYTTIKYYPNGVIAWVAIDSLGFNGNYATDIAVNGSGDIGVTGYGGYPPDYLTVKYFQYKSGDANDDGTLDVGDVVYLINYLFKGGPLPAPLLESGDATCNGTVDVGDVVYLINYLFKGGPAPSC
jgi:hypothetical protein